MKSRKSERWRRIMTRALVGIGGAAALAVGYFAFWFRENHGHKPRYGDVPTWLASIVGLLVLIVTLTQLVEQRKEITAIRQRQLKQDELLTRQLEREKRQHAKLVRAGELLVMPHNIQTFKDHPDGLDHSCAVAVRVTNDSDAAITNVSVQFDRAGSSAKPLSVWILEMRKGVPNVYGSTDRLVRGVRMDGTAVARLSPGGSVEFEADSGSVQAATETTWRVRFTDEYDTHWELGPLSALEHVENRDW